MGLGTRLSAIMQAAIFIYRLSLRGDKFLERYYSSCWTIVKHILKQYVNSSCPKIIIHIPFHPSHASSGTCNTIRNAVLHVPEEAHDG